MDQILSKEFDFDGIRINAHLIVLYDDILYSKIQPLYTNPWNPIESNPFNREILWPSSYSRSSPSYKFIATINAFRKALLGAFFSSSSIKLG
ncbi:17614_t:CDS:2 [Funneliformis caledonium]|uniref:17614_t:CDS:1 n=1 Tax=Funneliformis caledonium TaxID=1117310 RepID=A0A9N9CVW3_9GLOM|nr:17614_t:CDS:2 [Funneliformis caledonium]